MSEHTTPEVRNARFAIDERVPAHWHGGRAAVSTFFNNLSIFFPVGERFFIASIQAHKRFIDDDALARDVRAFSGQEGCHGREHERYNAMLAAHGYDVAGMEGRIERLLARVSKRTPKRWQLAATCALEHFTALMAHWLLSTPGLLDGADPTMAALWRWHSAEENEHKAVAFDVYQKAGGHYAERAGIMIVASLIFWAKIVEQQVRMMHTDGTLGSAREWRSLFTFLVVRPGGAFTAAKHYLAYFRPGFHPWDHDNRDLLEAWKAEYARTSVVPKAA